MGKGDKNMLYPYIERELRQPSFWLRHPKCFTLG